MWLWLWILLVLVLVSAHIKRFSVLPNVGTPYETYKNPRLIVHIYGKVCDNNKNINMLCGGLLLEEGWFKFVILCFVYFVSYDLSVVPP